MSVDLTKMPKLGFGMMRLPEKDGAIDLPQVCEMADAYLAAGFNYFDTAYMYHGGASERAVRQAVTERHPRASFQLATKLPQWMMDEGIDGRDRIFNDQLARTGAGYFDYYLLHSLEDGENDAGYTKYDCYNWALRLKDAGKIKHFGFSFHGTPALLERTLDAHPEVEFVQIQLNYADWENPIVQSGRLYDILHARQIPAIVMEPVKGGILANVPADVEKLFRAARPGASAASWALRFAASLDGVATVLSGMSSIGQMQENLALFRAFEPVTDADRAILMEAVRILRAQPTVPCTACRYCVDGCPQRIRIPDVFKALNELRTFPHDMRPHFYYGSLTEAGGRAKDCVQCGQCERVCPQHLPIIELLKEASSKLDVEME